MNKIALKNFAVESKKELIEKIQIKAMQYGIEKDKIKSSQIQSSDSIVINGKPLSKEEKQQREKLIDKIKSINDDGGDGYKDVIEEVAYTWFNRFTALRFMEVNDYLPTRVKALSSANPESAEPELIREAGNVDLPVDKQKIYDMKLNNDNEGLFKYMIITQCNALNKTLPFMFEKIGHYTELLFPDGLLNEGAFISRLTDMEVISENDWKDVQIIGWLYQYYNSEVKDEVIKAKRKYKKEEIPYATQLYTPDWIVRYMVQNTLGRYWVESHPEHSDLKKNWEFYLENPNPESDFEEKLAPYINKDLKVEDIKCFDPAMGSGHILVYMFDVLYQIYEKCGYMSREIPILIIENNLYGLDIDDRAYQLACFAVIMKGMKYNNRLLRSIERKVERTGEEGIRLNLASIQETNNLNDFDVMYISGESEGNNYNKVKEFIELFKNAKIYGSLINIEKFDKEFFINRLKSIVNIPAQDLIKEESRRKVIDILPLLLKQAKIMVETYDILNTNPPYMGTKQMNEKLNGFISNHYEKNKSDLFSAFIEYSFSKVKLSGHLGFMTPFVWMFISSYENLRSMIINQKNISSLIQLEYSAFEEATVPICTFTIRNKRIGLSGEYIRLSDFVGSSVQPIKTIESVLNPNVNYRFSVMADEFNKITGSPIAYWASNKIREIFLKNRELGDIAEPRQGMTTSDNNRFLRLWHEVDFYNIGFDMKNREEAKNSDLKWFPYNKGGEFRKWYGNNEFVVNYKNDGREMEMFHEELNKTSSGGRLKNRQYYFREGITWSFISSSKFGVRYSPEGYIFDVAGSSLFPNKSKLKYILGFLCSKITFEFLKIQNPTMNFQVENIKKLPIIYKDDLLIDKLVNENIILSKEEWDSFETSWDFKRHPFVTQKCHAGTIEEAYGNWELYRQSQFIKLKHNEEELNKIFINIYNLDSEMESSEDDSDVTIKKADNVREIKSFISYAIGCILGRYSLDQEGLAYAGGIFDSSKYITFKADEDNIIPVLSESYFEDDIVSRFVEFVKVIFGEETLYKNLDYIAEVIGKKNSETAKDTIRRYFINDFYKDHLQTYKNRPIYWMFTSGRQKAFNCLIYMHRYDKTTLSRIRTDYLHELQDRLDTARKSIIDNIEGDSSTKGKSEAKKKLTSLDKQIDELKKYDEILHHMADMQIKIDLDDGVKVNYEKFKGLLAKI